MKPLTPYVIVGCSVVVILLITFVLNVVSFALWNDTLKFNQFAEQSPAFQIFALLFVLGFAITLALLAVLGILARLKTPTESLLVLTGNCGQDYSEQVDTGGKTIRPWKQK